MVNATFKGVVTALVTPFRDGAVDEAAFRGLVERQIDAGVHGLAPCGTTGEVATLAEAERRRLVELTVEIAAGRVPVMAGAGSNATAEAIERVRHAREAGAQAALVVTPYYNRPSQEGLYRHFAAIAETVDLPLYVYNVPARTGVDIADETLARLSRLANIAGVKDATGDLARCSLQQVICAAGWRPLSGDDPSALGYMAHGGAGCISVTSNVAPEACAQLFEACMIGDWGAARALQARLIRLHKALFLDASPAPTKLLLAHLGLCADELRSPLVPCADAVRPKILEAFAAAATG